MAPKYILEQFLQQELLINITEHEVSPVPGYIGVSWAWSVTSWSCLGAPGPWSGVLLCCWVLALHLIATPVFPKPVFLTLVTTGNNVFCVHLHVFVLSLFLSLGY